ncbi:MAG: prepilin-type N-terminal cleavage/methylation domain-containing protein, partial [Bacilli bacterium]|nr:prepilin-type N-terminal cleavage/methylation domain-containing protein [Bacilli bacterium]
GFTLIELLATIVIIAIVMALVFPAATKMKQNNEGKLCEEYEKLMVEYARVNPKKDEDFIDLVELEELNKVKSDCNGYVVIDHTADPVTYKAYISCNNNCHTDGYENHAGVENTVVLKASNVTMTYLDTVPTFQYSYNESNFSENPFTSEITYTFTKTSGEPVEISSDTPAGTYYIIPHATVGNNYHLSIEKGTLTINKIQCQAPTNVNISTAGIITFTPSSNCSSSHQLRIDNGGYEVVTSGADKKNAITISPGTKTIYLKAMALNDNYSDSVDVTKPITVYSVTLSKGTGISEVSGTGNYINGSSVSISATLSANATWVNWTLANDSSEVISSSRTYTSTISSDWNYKANASFPELVFNNKTITKSFSTTDQIEDNGINEASNGSGNYTYAITSGNDNNYFSLNGRNLTIKESTPVNTSGYLVTITATDTNTSITKSATYTIIINKVDATCPITFNAYTGVYDASAHTITATGESGGTMKYRTATSGDGSTWTTTKPTRTNVGTTTVYVMIEGDDNHNDVTCGSKNISITKAASPMSIQSPQTWRLELTSNPAWHYISAAKNAAGTVTYEVINDGTYNGPYWARMESDAYVKAGPFSSTGTYRTPIKVVDAGNSNYNGKVITMYLDIVVINSGSIGSSTCKYVDRGIYVGSSSVGCTGSSSNTSTCGGASNCCYKSAFVGKTCSPSDSGKHIKAVGCSDSNWSQNACRLNGTNYIPNCSTPCSSGYTYAYTYTDLECVCE